MFVNECKLSGKVVADAAKRGGNGPVCISLQRGGSRKKDGSGTWPLEWFDVVAWENTIPDAAQIKRGQMITVHGRLKQESWTSPAGDKKSKVVIVATAIVDSAADEAQKPITPKGYDAKPNLQVTDQDIPF